MLSMLTMIVSTAVEPLLLPSISKFVANSPELSSSLLLRITVRSKPPPLPRNSISSMELTFISVRSTTVPSAPSMKILSTPAPPKRLSAPSAAETLPV